MESVKKTASRDLTEMVGIQGSIEAESCSHQPRKGSRKAKVVVASSDQPQTGGRMAGVVEASPHQTKIGGKKRKLTPDELKANKAVRNSKNYNNMKDAKQKVKEMEPLVETLNNKIAELERELETRKNETTELHVELGTLNAQLRCAILLRKELREHLEDPKLPNVRRLTSNVKPIGNRADVNINALGLKPLIPYAKLPILLFAELFFEKMESVKRTASRDLTEMVGIQGSIEADSCSHQPRKGSGKRKLTHEELRANKAVRNREHYNNMKDAKQKVKEMGPLVETLNNKIAEWERQLERQLETRKKETIEWRVVLGGLKTRLRATIQVLKEVREDLEILTNVNKKLESLIHKLIQELTEGGGGYGGNRLGIWHLRKEVHFEVQDAKQKVKEMEPLVETLNNKIAELERELETRKNETTELHVELGTLNAQLRCAILLRKELREHLEDPKLPNVRRLTSNILTNVNKKLESLIHELVQEV
ncbi:hypothetical protein SLEP1_g18578 [Rubroshorea leprosula]|uniref:Uncharacterized protein n=1 Tax=Rubroshorea leprosula TaxID=152421 RepID=A0AAV5J9T6_9ROSI|nr:hypothetical protein SLEP1_g18578 [Rubroshorea leprosula]